MLARSAGGEASLPEVEQPLDTCEARERGGHQLCLVYLPKHVRAKRDWAVGGRGHNTRHAHTHAYAHTLRAAARIWLEDFPISCRRPVPATQHHLFYVGMQRPATLAKSTMFLRACICGEDAEQDGPAKKLEE